MRRGKRSSTPDTYVLLDGCIRNVGNGRAKQLLSALFSKAYRLMVRTVWTDKVASTALRPPITTMAHGAIQHMCVGPKPQGVTTQMTTTMDTGLAWKNSPGASQNVPQERACRRNRWPRSVPGAPSGSCCVRAMKRVCIEVKLDEQQKEEHAAAAAAAVRKDALAGPLAASNILASHRLNPMTRHSGPSQGCEGRLNADMHGNGEASGICSQGGWVRCGERDRRPASRGGHEKAQVMQMCV